jgi:uncharacterized protein
MSCPVCGKKTVPTLKPFCSQRCATIDLGRWLSERYRVETAESPEPADNSLLQADDEEP